MSIHVHLLRYRYDDGSAKDWAYPVSTAAHDAQLTVYFGRSGSVLRTTDTPASSCQRHNPLLEALHRQQLKQIKGYVPLGEVLLNAQRRIVEPASPVVASPPVVAEVQYPLPRWYWRAPVLMDAALEKVLQSVVARLYTVGWIGEAQLLDWQTDPQALWQHLTQGRGQGVVELKARNRLEIATWLMLARAQVGVQLADEHADTVSHWPEALDLDPEILIALDLAVCRLAQWLNTDDAPRWFF